jgi:hypothetical protein
LTTLAGGDPDQTMANTSRAGHETDPTTRRIAERARIIVPGRLTWRDSRGMTRFATIVTRDVSESGVYLECRGSDAIPLYRLVYLQLERVARETDGLPPALRDGRVLSAVYRIGPCEPTTGTPSGYALRLLTEPRRRIEAVEPIRLDRSLRFETAARAVSLAGPIDREGGELSSLPTGSALI